MTEAEQAGLVSGFLSFEGEVLKIELSLECANPILYHEDVGPALRPGFQLRTNVLVIFCLKTRTSFLKQAVDGNIED